MRKHTQEFKEKIKEFGRQLDSKITFGETELDNEQLNSVTPVLKSSILKSVMKELDIDSNVDIPVGTILNYKSGVLLESGDYEYLDYGNYQVYSSEKQEDNNAYNIVAYDKMLNSMIPYEKMEIQYPISVRDYLKAICEKLNIKFANENTEFANFDKMIPNELYLDSEGNSLDYTFRDVLDELAQVTASNIIINKNDELEVKYISNTAEGLEQVFNEQPFVIEDAGNYNVENLILYGNSEQDTRSDKNKFAITQGGSGYGITATYNEDGTFNFKGTASSSASTNGSTLLSHYFTFDEMGVENGKTYTISSNKTIPEGLGVRFEVYNESDSGAYTWVRGVIGQMDNARPVRYGTLNTEGGNRIRLSFQVFKDAVIDIENIGFQIEEGTVATDWQPYGAMPSPDFPSEVKNVEPIENLFLYDFEDNISKNNNETYSTTFENDTLTIKVLKDTIGNNVFSRFKINPNLLKNGKKYLIRSTNVSGVVNSLSLQLRNKDGSSANLPVANEIVYNDNYDLYVVRNVLGTGNVQLTAGMTAIIKNIQVEEEKVHTYVPYGNWLKGKITRKNLLKIDDFKITNRNGINIEAQNSKIHIYGTSTQNQNITITNAINKDEINSILLGKNIVLSSTINFPHDAVETSKGVSLFFTKPGDSFYIPIYPGGKNAKRVFTEAFSNVNFYFNANIKIDFEFSLQLEEGTEATEYEPYRGKDFLYDISKYDEEGNIIGYHELSKINEIKDDLDLISGVLNKKIGKYVFNGNESIEARTSNNEGYFVYVILENIMNNMIPYKLKDNVPCVCTHFTYGGTVVGANPVYNSKDICFYLYYNSNFMTHAMYFNTTIPTLDEFKTFLKNQYNAGTPITIYYELETPEQYQFSKIDIELFEGYNKIIIENKYNLLSEATINYLSKDDTIDEEYLKDVNVAFGEKYGPVNSIVLSRSAGSDNVYLQDEQSVVDNGLCELKISDNQIMNFNNRSDYLSDILNKLNGLEFYINDFSSTGVCYYEIADKYNVKIGENTYNCIMFNDEINITQGLEEKIHTDLPEQAETDYTKADKTDRKINQTYLIVDKQNQQIESLISQSAIQDEKLTQVTQTVDELNQTVAHVTDTTVSGETQKNLLKLDDVFGGPPIEMTIRPINESISYLYPKNNLNPSNNLYMTPRTIRFENLETKEVFDYELPDDLLYLNSNVYDELKIDYNNNLCQIEKKCGYNADGTIYQLSKPIINQYDFPIFNLTKGNYNIYLLHYELAYIYCKFSMINDYTNVFATRVEMNSNIKQTAENINFEVSKKVDENEIISKINQSAEQIQINADKISLDGKEINLTAGDINIKSNKLSIDSSGAITCTDIKVIQGDIYLVDDGTEEGVKFNINSDYYYDENNNYSFTNLILSNGIKNWGSGINYNSFFTSSIELAMWGSGNFYPSLQLKYSTDGIDLETYVGAGGITTPQLTQTSLSTQKKNFELFKNGLEILKQIDIYKYNLKFEDDNDKKHLGFVIGDEFNYSEEITSNDNKSVDLYSMTSLCLQAIKEQQKMIEKLQEEVKKLKGEK